MKLVLRSWNPQTLRYDEIELKGKESITVTPKMERDDLFVAPNFVITDIDIYEAIREVVVYIHPKGAFLADYPKNALKGDK